MLQPPNEMPPTSPGLFLAILIEKWYYVIDFRSVFLLLFLGGLFVVFFLRKHFKVLFCVFLEVSCNTGQNCFFFVLFFYEWKLQCVNGCEGGVIHCYCSSLLAGNEVSNGFRSAECDRQTFFITIFILLSDEAISLLYLCLYF